MRRGKAGACEDHVTEALRAAESETRAKFFWPVVQAARRLGFGEDRACQDQFGRDPNKASACGKCLPCVIRGLVNCP